MKLTKAKYKDLRESALKIAGELGTLAEINESTNEIRAYDKSCEMLDSIDEIGFKLGYLDIETCEYL